MRLYLGTKVSRSFIKEKLLTTIFLLILKRVNIYFNDEFIELYIRLEYLL
jgi:hypothetical protein